VIKLKLYPTTDQRAKLDQLFAAHRGVHNMAVAQSWRDCLPIFATKKRKKANARGRQRPRTKKSATRTKFKTIAELSSQYCGISSSERMPSYFRNKRALERHLQVPAEVRGNAFRDFLKAVKASRALYFSLKARGKPTTFPVLSFKSKYSRSDSIALRPESVRLVDQQSEQHHNHLEHAKKRRKALVRILPRFFGFQMKYREGEAVEGIKIAKPPPELLSSKLKASVRLQRLREGDYYLVVPRAKSWEQQDTDRVCALDPGVRQFLTLYDPRGRTLSIDDTNAVLKRRFDAIDGMKSELEALVNASKEHHKTKIPTRKKAQAARCATRRKKTAMHRRRYRLRRRIRYTNRRVTRMVHDMHQKITSWLASNYRCVLLPSFQTAEMVRLYEREEAADGTPETCSDERAPPALALTESLEEDVDEQEMPTTRPRRRKRERVIRSSTARAMLAQAHFKFKVLLRYKLARVGGRLVDCEEEYTSKTCSSCGTVNDTLGGDRVFRCSACHVRLDRDVNAARNILIKNREMLAL
jgi:transposase